MGGFFVHNFPFLTLLPTVVEKAPVAPMASLGIPPPSALDIQVETIPINVRGYYVETIPIKEGGIIVYEVVSYFSVLKTFLISPCFH